jgi:hypothetical protein
MKFFSIDVETTGISKGCIPLQYGCVAVDTESPEWPTFEIIIKHTFIKGEPFALNMNRSIIERIAKGEGVHEPEAVKELSEFIRKHVDPEDNGETGTYFAIAGKNYAGFDARFINWPSYMKPRHRTLDPGSVYARSYDRVPPDLRVCCERAGVPYDESQLHNALYDAMLVALCMAKHLATPYDWEKNHDRRN